MKLRQLFEALNNEVAIIFGRFNPPHKGHRAAWELASKSPVWYVGTNQSTVGPKDPLPFDVKVEAMKTVWPEVEGHIVAETSWLTLASKIYKEKPNATLLCLTDEDWVTKTIQQYNGVEGAHGYYNFKKIEQKPTPRLSSATALRDAVTKGDREAFSQAAGVSADTEVAGKPFFDLVAEYLLPYANAPKKVAKKKVAQPVESVVENFADGRNPQDKGDSKRHGVPTKASVTTLRKIAKQGGRKGQLAHWMANMKSGRTKSEEVEEAAGPAQQAAIAIAMKKAGKKPKSESIEESSRDICNVCGQTPCNCTHVHESDSKAMAQTAKRLTDPKDGAVAKLRAAGDKRREDQLKYRDLAKKNEDAAGVGIITKQNTTKDVNKSTPRKNLKAYKLI